MKPRIQLLAGVFALCLFCVSQLFAQDSSSVYPRYGMGLSLYSGHAFSEESGRSLQGDFTVGTDGGFAWGAGVHAFWQPVRYFQLRSGFDFLENQDYLYFSWFDFDNFPDEIYFGSHTTDYRIFSARGYLEPELILHFGPSPFSMSFFSGVALGGNTATPLTESMSARDSGTVVEPNYNRSDNIAFVAHLRGGMGFRYENPRFVTRLDFVLENGLNYDLLAVYDGRVTFVRNNGTQGADALEGRVGYKNLYLSGRLSFDFCFPKRK